MTLTTRVAALSDLAAVAVCEELATALLAQPGDPIEAAIANLPDELAAELDPELRAGLNERYHVALPPDLSVSLARTMLAHAAVNPLMAVTLETVLAAHRDSKQFALEVLALGAAISMVIFSATTTIKDGRLGKTALSPELAKQLSAWLSNLKPWANGGNG